MLILDTFSTFNFFKLFFSKVDQGRVFVENSFKKFDLISFFRELKRLYFSFKKFSGNLFLKKSSTPLSKKSK
jgi:hypothetical protein